MSARSAEPRPANEPWPANEPRPANDLRPVVVQHAGDGTVLMLAWANEDALAATRRTGEAHFWSRSREELWHKGATSGNRLEMVDIGEDCDGDALLYRVRPTGPACHTGTRSCFAAADRRMTLERLEDVIGKRATASPRDSYTARLLEGGAGQPARKVIEEAAELATAALAQDDAALAGEAADLLYHLLVTLRSRGLALERVLDVLAERHETAAR